MFRARKFAEVPAKRSNGLLTPLPSELLAASKRQRLERWDALYQSRPAPTSALPDDDDAGALLLETRECSIAEAEALPAAVADELRREWAAMPRHQRRGVRCCRASVPSARHRSGRHWVPFYVFPLRAKVLLWQQERAKVTTLALPDELEPEEELHPFLFALDGQSLALLVVGKSGIVLFWEDIALPYESIPLSVQIPLAPQEEVRTHPSASLAAALDERRAAWQDDGDMQAPADDVASLVCWSNQGNVWEVALEDRRIRVRAFDKQSAGFLSGLSKSVSQFFFSSAGSRSGAGGSYGGELDVNQPIQSLRVLPASVGDGVSSGSNSGAAEDDESADMLVLFQDGVLERRSFSTADVLDCAMRSLWHFDATRVAISYFSDNFPDAHLAKVAVVSLPYVHESCFALLVAFVCSSSARSDDAKVKYALFQFALAAVDDDAAAPPEPEWACVLDYEPSFQEQQDSSCYFEVDSFAITRGALYLVWPHVQPVQFSTILLPQAGQSSVRSAAFSLQGVPDRSALAFGARVGPSSLDANAVKGSVTFLLLAHDAPKTLTGSVCVATASNMQKLPRVAAPTPSEAAVERTRQRREELSRVTGESSHFLGENQAVDEYIRLLLTHFHDDPTSASALRMNAQDVAVIAQAAVAVDFQILDAKPSSGLRWGKTEAGEELMGRQEDAPPREADLTSVTPKLVRYQLEDKCARHAAFVAFLQRRCAVVWAFLERSTELRRLVAEDEEKLQAAIALSKFQASILSSDVAEDKDETSSSEVYKVQRRLTGKFLLHAIEKTVEKRGYQKEQLRLAGYNAFDVFYCEVSKVSELFVVLDDEVQQLVASMGESDPTYLYALLESGYGMLSMLCTPVSSSTTGLSTTGSWAFTREVREVLVNHIARLSALVGYSQTSTMDKPIRWQHDDVFEITDQILRLGCVLLDAYQRFLPLVQPDEAEDLRKEEDVTKRSTLNPLIFIATQTAWLQGDALAVDFDQDGAVTRKRAELFAQCVELSDKYAYFEGMAFLVYKEDAANLRQLDYVLGRRPKSAAAKRLETYCKTREGFDEFLFRWYNGEVRDPWAYCAGGVDAGSCPTMMASLLADSQLFASALHMFMKDREHLAKHRWITAIATERYSQTASLALREATREHRSLPKRKTMASIAKIASLATPSPPRQEKIQEINNELVRGKLQEILLQLPLKQEMATRPLSPEGLVHACLEASLSVAKDDPLRTNLFLMALEALDTMAVEPLSEEFEDMRADVWRAGISDDEELWSSLMEESAAGVNEEKLEAMMRETLLYSAMKQYLARHDRSVGPLGIEDATDAAGLTIETIRELVQHEGDAPASVISAQSQQLLIKTLHLAHES